uniref:CCHC-type domain-containing protein n=1 Tax=Macrostomum lignano TaxID=282301 RepID=A0A1I8GG92_9PLAT
HLDTERKRIDCRALHSLRGSGSSDTWIPSECSRWGIDDAFYSDKRMRYRASPTTRSDPFHLVANRAPGYHNDTTNATVSCSPWNPSTRTGNQMDSVKFLPCPTAAIAHTPSTNAVVVLGASGPDSDASEAFQSEAFPAALAAAVANFGEPGRTADQVAAALVDTVAGAAGQSKPLDASAAVAGEAARAGHPASNNASVTDALCSPTDVRLRTVDPEAHVASALVASRAASVQPPGAGDEASGSQLAARVAGSPSDPSDPRSAGHSRPPHHRAGPAYPPADASDAISNRRSSHSPGLQAAGPSDPGFAAAHGCGPASPTVGQAFQLNHAAAHALVVAAHASAARWDDAHLVRLFTLRGGELGSVTSMNGCWVCPMQGSERLASLTDAPCAPAVVDSKKPELRRSSSSMEVGTSGHSIAVISDGSLQLPVDATSSFVFIPVGCTDGRSNVRRHFKAGLPAVQQAALVFALDVGDGISGLLCSDSPMSAADSGGCRSVATCAASGAARTAGAAAAERGSQAVAQTRGPRLRLANLRLHAGGRHRVFPAAAAEAAPLLIDPLPALALLVVEVHVAASVRAVRAGGSPAAATLLQSMLLLCVLRRWLSTAAYNVLPSVGRVLRHKRQGVADARHSGLAIASAGCSRLLHLLPFLRLLLLLLLNLGLSSLDFYLFRCRRALGCGVNCTYTVHCYIELLVTVLCLLCGDAAACGATNRCGLEGEACYLFYGYSSYGGINYNSKCCDGLKSTAGWATVEWRASGEASQLPSSASSSVISRAAAGSSGCSLATVGMRSKGRAEDCIRKVPRGWPQLFLEAAKALRYFRKRIHSRDTALTSLLSNFLRIMVVRGHATCSSHRSGLPVSRQSRQLNPRVAGLSGTQNQAEQWPGKQADSSLARVGPPPLAINDSSIYHKKCTANCIGYGRGTGALTGDLGVAASRQVKAVGVAPEDGAHNNWCRDQDSTIMANLDDLIGALTARIQEQLNVGQRVPRPNNKYVPTQDFALWLQQFTTYCEAAQIPEDQRKQNLLSLLDFGTAFKAVANLELDDDLDYAEFVEQLEARFSQNRTPQDYKTEFQNRSQREGEALEDYADALRELMRKAYPALPGEQRDELAKDRFLKGIRVPDRVLENVLLQDPDTLQAAIQRVRQTLASMKLLEGKRSVHVVNSQAAAAAADSQTARMAAEIASLKAEIAQLKQGGASASAVQPNPQQPAAAPQAGRTCGRCLQMGHSTADCRNRVVCLACGQQGHTRSRCQSQQGYSESGKRDGGPARPASRAPSAVIEEAPGPTTQIQSVLGGTGLGYIDAKPLVCRIVLRQAVRMDAGEEKLVPVRLQRRGDSEHVGVQFVDEAGHSSWLVFAGLSAQQPAELQLNAVQSEGELWSPLSEVKEWGACGLSDAEAREFVSLVAKNRDVFAKDSSELGLTNLMAHEIDTDHVDASTPPQVMCWEERCLWSQRQLIRLDAQVLVFQGPGSEVPKIIILPPSLFQKVFIDIGNLPEAVPADAPEYLLSLGHRLAEAHSHPNEAAKFHNYWKGPAEVVEKLSDINFRILHQNSRKSRVVHYNNLRKVPQRPVELQASRPPKQRRRKRKGQRAVVVVSEEPQESEPDSDGDDSQFVYVPAAVHQDIQAPQDQPVHAAAPPASPRRLRPRRNNPPARYGDPVLY